MHTHHPKLCFAALLAGVSVAIAQELPVPHVGLDVNVDAVSGLAPSSLRNTSLQGTALAFAEWATPHNEGETPAWQGYASVLGLAGKGPTEKFVGDLNALSNLEANKGVRLYSWWGELNQESLSLRAGALLADEEFATTDSGSALFNSGFGWPGFISGNTVNTGPAFFIPALGLRVKYEVHPSVTLQAIATDGDSFDSVDGDSSVNRYGWRYHLNRDQGAFGMAAVCYHADALPVTLKLGGWVHSGNFADTYLDAAGLSFASSGEDPRQHGSNHGTYLVLTRTQEKPFGLPGTWDTHLRYGWSPPDRNAVKDAVDVGWAWSGLLPGRDDDTLALGYLRTQLSAGFTRSLVELDPASVRLGHEEVVEVGYHWQITEHYSLHPDFQVIRAPGGDPSRASAKVLILRFSASF